MGGGGGGRLFLHEDIVSHYFGYLYTLTDILFPFLQHPGISRLGKFSVSSQVSLKLYTCILNNRCLLFWVVGQEHFYTDMKFRPKKDKDCHYVPSSQLPPMISSVESKLGTLHIIDYVHVELARPQMWQKRNALGETGNQLRSHDSSSSNARKRRRPQ